VGRDRRNDPLRSFQPLQIGSIEDLAGPTSECAMILYCDDHWHFQTQQKINQQCQTLGIPWLRASCEFGTGIIGPCVDPSVAGCVACAETRRRTAMSNAQSGVVEILAPSHDPTLFSEQDGNAQRMREQPWLTASHLEILAQLLVQEVSTYLKTPDKVQTRRALLALDLDTLHFQRHRFLPEPECPVCGRMLPDTPEAATITLQSRLKLFPSTYHTRSFKAHAKEILETYVDEQTGLIPALVRNSDAPFAMVTAWIGISDGGERHTQMSGTGRTLSYEQSQLAAITDALERYGGQRPKTKRTTVWASYRELGEQALDPTTLGLHTDEQYALPEFRYIPYHHDLRCGWVWGYSFQRQAPILIPEHIGYYGFLRFGAVLQTAFVYETFNGCALGNCLEEAIYYGILEVAKHDAFLLAWYAQLSLPRLDLESATDPRVFLLLENLEHARGYTIQAFNATLDHGVPCCWVMAIDEQDRAEMPKALCMAGSHPNPELAVLNALRELNMMVNRPFDDFLKARAKAREMLTNPLAVKEIRDHSKLYYWPEAFERLSFLYEGNGGTKGGTSRTATAREVQTFQEAFGDFYQRKPHMDLRDDLTALMDHYLARDIDIIVVNQTAPEHTAQDFHCVKVIMPGMLPMTFGHQYRRNTGFQRLYHLPAQLGYRNGPLSDADINPHPHPFP